MNPLISPTSSLFLPLNQLSPHCNRLLNSLNDGRSSLKERILFEQTLWNEVKKIRALNDSSIFLYLIGYYHVILYQVAKLPPSNDLFQYHVLIRVGDLNRYMQRSDVAEYYYCNARNLFPYFGHAYNQLGLLTKPTNCYKCCYYYARAARSRDKPLNSIADSNLRIAVSKYNCEILNHILNDEACLKITEGVENNKLPETTFEWFYVIVVAIYADNIKPITKTFLSYLNENFSTQRATMIRDNNKTTVVYCERESFILLASLDILLDWLRLGSQGKNLLSVINCELRQIKSCLQTILASFRDNSIYQSSNVSSITNNSSTPRASSLNQTMGSANQSNNSNSTLQDSTFTSASDSSSKDSSLNKPPALPHDYVLRGFSPLEPVHQELFFKVRHRVGGKIGHSSVGDDLDCQKYIDTGQLKQIIMRIKSKMDAFGPLIRRRTRNIALESILSNMDQGKN